MCELENIVHILSLPKKFLRFPIYVMFKASLNFHLQFAIVVDDSHFISIHHDHEHIITMKLQIQCVLIWALSELTINKVGMNVAMPLTRCSQCCRPCYKEGHFRCQPYIAIYTMVILAVGAEI